jgi:ATP-dependent Lon protease
LNITIDDLDSKYLKKYHKVQETKIPAKSAIGIINGLWANALGKGGIIPIETMFFPSSSFLDLRLTGLQGDVMKESMNVAKSLAWKLTSLEKKKSLLKLFEETKCQGLHIHCPQGAVAKDGPSAGTAITIAIYSLLNNLTISNTIAMLPLSLHQEVGENSNIAYSKPLNNVLYRLANKEITAFTFKQTMQSHVLLYGNAYAEKVINIIHKKC